MDEIYRKDFDAWNVYAKKLNEREFSGHVREREVWWCALGVNIGSEQDGKNESFERPVLIIKRLSHHTLLIVPLTSSIEVHRYRIDAFIAGRASQIIISQIRVISTKRLMRKIGWLKELLFQIVLIEIARCVLDSIKGETPP